MLTPVKTIIRNKKPVAKAVTYIGKSPVWLPANGEVVVDFEIWSVASDSQKTSIKTLCETGAIELSVMLMGSNGEYTVVPFDPIGGKKVTPVVAPVEPKPKAILPIKEMVNEKDHIVKVGNAETKKIMEDMGAKAIGFQDEDILPPREVKNGEPEQKQEEAPAEAATEEEAPKKAKKSSKQKA